MDKARELARGGWHSDRGEGKGLSSLLHRNTNKDSEPASTRPAAPLSSLRDPSSFGPPPKSVNHPNYIPPAGGSANIAARPVPARPVGTKPATYQYRSRPAAPSTAAIQDDNDNDERPPPGPFRVNTTGLSVRGLPAPPTRIVQRSETLPMSNPSPTSTSTTTKSSQPSPAPALKPKPPTLPSRAIPATSLSSAASTDITSIGPGKPSKPSLPPRLPPREKTTTSPSNNATTTPALAALSSSPMVQQQTAAMLNQGAVSRLGAAGVNVPGFGIGGSSSSSSGNGGDASGANQTQVNPHAASLASAAVSKAAANPAATRQVLGMARQTDVNELQDRFSRIRASTAERDSSGSGATAPTPFSALRGKAPAVPLGTKPR